MTAAVRSLTDFEQVIVQAGGRGSRLGAKTALKPKCLLSVNRRPLLYRMFDTWPHARFIVVGDYKIEVLASYLEAFPPPVSVQLVAANGNGSSAGLKAATAYAEECPTILTWCDLLYEPAQCGQVFASEAALSVGVTSNFACRWSVSDSRLVNVPSSTAGVMGLFAMQSTSILEGAPETGEFVRYLAEASTAFETFELNGVAEVGSAEGLARVRLPDVIARPFNRVLVGERSVSKQCIDPAYAGLIVDEVAWYDAIKRHDLSLTPAVLSREPLKLERLHGQHPHQLSAGGPARSEVLSAITNAIAKLHLAGDPKAADVESVTEMYVDKPVKRVASVASLLPLMRFPDIKVNGVSCQNPFHESRQRAMVERLAGIRVPEFTLIHGDPTFSNMIIQPNGEPKLFDPRGRFGRSALFGDPDYDWAKLLYSVVGNYDSFNSGDFSVTVTDASVSVSIKSNGYEPLAEMVRERAKADRATLDLMHAVIWLSLTGYVADDIDAMVAAFSLGLFYLETSEQ